MDTRYDLTISRLLKAPRRTVWRAWAEPEHFVKWWAPAPVVTTSQEHDLRAGGGFSTTMCLEDGTEHAGHGCFLDVVEHERIVFTDALQAGWRPNKEPFMTAIITLEDHPDGTTYSALVLHNNEADRQKHADMGFESGWGKAIEQLNQLALQLSRSI
ncbi:MAG: SRPBCC family protein [Pseudomonadota bacterium]